jgi:CheY-like chemotaxis protein
VVTVVAEKGVAAGYAIHDYLIKPVRAEQLLASLQRAGIAANAGRPILVVDDDSSARKLMETTLQSLGYRSLCAPGGEEGLRIAAEDPPAAVVLDLMMPGVDGFAFLDRFRQSSTGQATPVIVWTAKDLTAEDHARLSSSAQAVVLKREGSTRSLIDELRGYVPALTRDSARPEHDDGR